MAGNQKSPNGLNEKGVPVPPFGYVSKVKQTWQQFEDFGLAHKLQNEEFNQHFDQNRSERRLVAGDIRLSKEEQEQEDRRAAEYLEQLRRDREREDERLAKRIQRQLELETGTDVSAKRAIELQDEMLARRLQEMEMAKTTASKLENQPSGRVFAGPSNGHQPMPQRHGSFPTDRHGQKYPPAKMQQSHKNPIPDFSANADSISSTADKKSPPPRPPPPRHNSFR